MSVNISFTVTQTKRGELARPVPHEVIDKGREAVKNYLINKGHVESCLDYGEAETEIILHNGNIPS